MIKVTVVAECRHPAEGHPEPFNDHRVLGTGRHVVVSSRGVALDGEWIVLRDRRAKVNRTPGHPWIAAGAAWTSFDIAVAT